jgi:hypothetical protein
MAKPIKHIANLEVGSATLVDSTDGPSSGTVFCTLPAGFLNSLQRFLGKDAFVPAGLLQEYEWSQWSGDHTQSVGFWGKNQIIFNHLRRKRVAGQIDQATLNRLNWPFKLAEVERMLDVGNSRLERIWKISRGYIGWLMTTRQFLEEHDKLIEKHSAEIEQWGFPSLSRPIVGQVPEGLLLPKPEARLQEFFQSFDDFYVRWRLVKLAAPNLPVPLQSQTPVAAPILALGPQNQGGSLFFLPDTFPIPSRDELRVILEESLRNSASPAHLAEWHKLVSGKNPAKNKIARFGKIFEIQHYYRILHQRHHDALAGRLGKLELALAEFLKVEESTVHADMVHLRKRLGANWMSRRSRFETPVELIAPPAAPLRKRPARKAP